MRTCHCRRTLPLVPFRHLAVVVLVPGWILQAVNASGESKSSLSEVIEQAKKPVDEQEAVQRESDGGFSIDALVSILGMVCERQGSSCRVAFFLCSF